MKPLRILLGNNTLSLLAGSETWTYTLAVQLKAMGHHVACFSPELGIISEKLEDLGIHSYSTLDTGDLVLPHSFILEEKIDHNYDVIIANHFHIVEMLRTIYPTKPIISTIHGVLHFMEDGVTKAPEHPALDSGVNQFVAVSEEIQEKLKKDYSIDAVIVRNAFDMGRYSVIPAVAEKPRCFMVNTNYADINDPFFKSVREAAKLMGARVAAVGQNFAQQFDLSRALTDSDVVFGMGRSVLEGVAAGRLGIVYGRWGLGGVVTKETSESLRYYNYSGRNAVSRDAVSPEEIVKLITDHYRPSVLQEARRMVMADHNVAYAAEAYVRLARELTGQAFVRPGSITNLGVDPNARRFKLATPS